MGLKTSIEPSCKKDMKELSVFVFVSPETGQALVEDCAAGCGFGSRLEPEVGI